MRTFEDTRFEVSSYFNVSFLMWSSSFIVNQSHSCPNSIDPTRKLHLNDVDSMVFAARYKVCLISIHVLTFSSLLHNCRVCVCLINSSSPEQSGRRFTNDIFNCIWKVSYLIRISLNCVPKDPIDNNPALVEKMAWRRIGDKSLSEPMLTRFIDAYMRC